MARADTVSLTYTAEIADLKKKLAEIPGATGKEAKKAVAEVSKAVKLVAKAEAEAKKAAEGSAAGLKSLGDAAGKTNESFASMGAALSTVSPELGGMVSRIGAVANGLKGAANASQLMGGSLATMVGTLGIAGVAAGAAFIAYQTMAREMEQAAGMTRLLREVSDSLEPSLRQLEAAELALAVATGATTKEQAAQITTQRAARDAVLDYAKAQRAQREEQQATIESAVKWKQAIDSATFGPLGKGRSRGRLTRCSGSPIRSRTPRASCGSWTSVCKSRRRRRRASRTRCWPPRQSPTPTPKAQARRRQPSSVRPSPAASSSPGSRQSRRPASNWPR
jgi:hypothetical protein